MLLQHCYPTTVILHPLTPAPPHPTAGAGLLVAIRLSAQAADALKQNESLLWDVPTTLPCLRLFSD